MLRSAVTASVWVTGRQVDAEKCERPACTSENWASRVWVTAGPIANIAASARTLRRAPCLKPRRLRVGAFFLLPDAVQSAIATGQRRTAIAGRLFGTVGSECGTQ